MLGRAEVKFCGYLISDDGIRPPPEKLDAIKNCPKPTTVKGLKSFLGAVNFYRAAIPNFATIAAPLHKLLQGKKPRFAPLVFWLFLLSRHRKAFLLLLIRSLLQIKICAPGNL